MTQNAPIKLSEITHTRQSGGPGDRAWRWWLLLWPKYVLTERRHGYREWCWRWGIVRRAKRRTLPGEPKAYAYLSRK